MENTVPFLALFTTIFLSQYPLLQIQFALTYNLEKCWPLLTSLVEKEKYNAPFPYIPNIVCWSAFRQKALFTCWPSIFESLSPTVSTHLPKLKATL